MYLKGENSSDVPCLRLISDTFNFKKYIFYIYYLPFKMLMKNIFAAVALAGLAVASPVEDIEERSSCKSGNNWCCASAVPLKLFFIQGSGSDCKRKLV
jgi:hypothetical protein